MIGLRLLVAAALATLGAGAAVAAPLKVVATFSVLGDMVSTIAGDRVDLVTIVGGDGDTELYQATPADARTLADADLLVENDINPEFEPWLEGLIKVSGFKGTRLVASKGAKIIDMIGRAKGATLAEIMKATDWQAHSVRGFISTAGKKHGVKIESAKNDAGERSYRIAK